jgi:hypothetical protein
MDTSGDMNPVWHTFSTSIAIDGKNRLWIRTNVRQIPAKDILKVKFNVPDLYCYEIYDENGILLQRIPWEYGSGRKLVYITGDRLFFVSSDDSCVYEYRIVESGNK